MTATRRAHTGAWSGLTLLETAAVMLIVAVLAVPMVAVAARLIVLPVEWQNNLGDVRDAREALHWVASDARQAACYTESQSEGHIGTFEWTDYTETPAREFSVRYSLTTPDADGRQELLRAETVDALQPKTITIGYVEGFNIRRNGRLIHAEVHVPSRSIQDPNISPLEIAALMRPSGQAIADC